MPEVYIIIAWKIFFPIFWGSALPAPSLVRLSGALKWCYELQIVKDAGIDKSELYQSRCWSSVSKRRWRLLGMRRALLALRGEAPRELRAGWWIDDDGTTWVVTGQLVMTRGRVGELTTDQRPPGLRSTLADVDSIRLSNAWCTGVDERSTINWLYATVWRSERPPSNTWIANIYTHSPRWSVDKPDHSHQGRSQKFVCFWGGIKVFWG